MFCPIPPGRPAVIGQQCPPQSSGELTKRPPIPSPLLILTNPIYLTQSLPSSTAHTLTLECLRTPLNVRFTLSSLSISLGNSYQSAFSGSDSKLASPRPCIRHRKRVRRSFWCSFDFPFRRRWNNRIFVCLFFSARGGGEQTDTVE